MRAVFRPLLIRAKVSHHAGVLSAQRAQRSKTFEISIGIENFEREWNFRASHPPRPYFLWGNRDVEIEIFERDQKFRSRSNISIGIKFFWSLGPLGGGQTGAGPQVEENMVFLDPFRCWHTQLEWFAGPPSWSVLLMESWYGVGFSCWISGDRLSAMFAVLQQPQQQEHTLNSCRKVWWTVLARLLSFFAYLHSFFSTLPLREIYPWNWTNSWNPFCESSPLSPSPGLKVSDLDPPFATFSFASEKALCVSKTESFAEKFWRHPNTKKKLPFWYPSVSLPLCGCC